MKEAVLQRIIRIKEFKNLSTNKLASEIGMPQTTVNNYFKGIRAVSVELVLAILNSFPDISAEWLLRGEEPMLKSNKTTNTFNIKGTDNSVQLNGSSSVQGSVTTGGSDKEIMMKLIEQNQQLMAMLMKK